jgi:hypothetical protein
VTKLFGYDYEIIYKKSKENLMADALSNKYEEEGSIFSRVMFLVGLGDIMNGSASLNWFP